MRGQILQSPQRGAARVLDRRRRCPLSAPSPRLAEVAITARRSFGIESSPARRTTSQECPSSSPSSPQARHNWPSCLMIRVGRLGVDHQLDLTLVVPHAPASAPGWPCGERDQPLLTALMESVRRREGSPGAVVACASSAAHLVFLARPGQAQTRPILVEVGVRQPHEQEPACPSCPARECALSIAVVQPARTPQWPCPGQHLAAVGAVVPVPPAVVDLPQRGQHLRPGRPGSSTAQGEVLDHQDRRACRLWRSKPPVAFSDRSRFGRGG